MLNEGLLKGAWLLITVDEQPAVEQGLSDAWLMAAEALPKGAWGGGAGGIIIDPTCPFAIYLERRLKSWRIQAFIDFKRKGKGH